MDMAGRVTLFEVLVSHLVPGLVLSVAVFMFADLSTCQDLAAMLVDANPVYVGAAAIIAGLVLGPTLDALHHIFLDIHVLKRYSDWRKQKNRRSIFILGGLFPGVFPSDGERKQTLFPVKMVKDYNANILEVWREFRMSQYHWSEFYINTAMAILLLSIAALIYLGGGWVWIWAVIGFLVSGCLFCFWLGVNFDYDEAMKKVFAAKDPSLPTGSSLG